MSATADRRPGVGTAQAEAPWRLRFRGARVSVPRAPREAPDRCVYATNASGVWQLASWDRTRDAHTTVTAKRTGVHAGLVSPDGAEIVYFDDGDGDEVGTWMACPFAGGPARPWLPHGVGPGWSAGIALHPARTVVGFADRAQVAVWVVEPDGARPLDRFTEPLHVAACSPDGRLVALEHAEHGDTLHPSTRVYDAVHRTVVAELGTPGASVVPTAFSPQPDTDVLAVATDADGRLRPLVVELRTGQRRHIAEEIPGDVVIVDFWPDGQRALVHAEHDGRSRLLISDLVTGVTEPLTDRPGTVGAALVRPDGEVWYAFGDSAHAGRVWAQRDGAEQVLLTPDGPSVPPGRAYREVRYDNGEGGQVHGFLAVPDGAGPHPLVVEAHGGPAAHVSDHLDPTVQAWVDHGFAVLAANYRGSSGYGQAWEERLVGDPGGPELVDLAAGARRLVEDGIADPARLVLVGASWGGYLTLLGLGTQPALWAAGVATVPVADYLRAYAEESPDLQAYDRALFGGSPADLPELYTARSPVTYVEQVTAPLLILTGANDTRCPRGQVDGYVERLRATGAHVDYDVFDAGHGSLDADEQIRQQARALDFLAAVLGTPPAA